MMDEARQLLVGCVLALAVLLPAAVLTEFEPLLLGELSYEDGIIENATALLMALGGVFFFLLLRQLRAQRTPLLWLMPTIAWLFFCVFVAGEEISWGQRIFGWQTPETLAQYNHQQEVNLHNLTVAGMSMNSRRLFNLVTFVIAVVAPAIALVPMGRRLIQATRTPVMPLVYVPLCLASFVYIKYYAFHGANFTNEVRELIFCFSIFLFAVHAAFRPGDVFRSERASAALGVRRHRPSDSHA